MSILKEYDVDAGAVEEWLPWGGLTMPFVMQQKGGSCFSVIEYTPYVKTKLTKAMATPSFRRGWAIWSECQHTPEGERHFLVIFWNPFVTPNHLQIGNTLGTEVEKENFLAYFGQEVQGILREIQTVTTATLLQYQEMMDFLSFSLSMGDSKALMPEIPLYMDALLTQDINFDFRANDIFINDKRVLIFSLPSLPETEEILSLVQDVSFRAVRRMLLFDQGEVKTEMRKYAGKWCPLRKTMRERIMEGIVSEVNGYLWDGLIFHLEESVYDEIRTRITEYLTEECIPFCFEEYNLKDVWWGSLPGVFLANITPPLMGVSSLENFLAHTEEAREQETQHRFRHLLDAMQTDDGDKKGVDLEYVSDGSIPSQ